MTVESPAPSLPPPGLPTPVPPAPGLPTPGLAARGPAAPVPPPPAPPAPGLPVSVLTMSGSPTPTLPGPSLPTVPTLSSTLTSTMTPSLTPSSSVPLVAPTAPTLPAATPRSGQKWKPIQRSKARKALNGLIGVGVLAALAGGAWFGYQSLTPAEDTTTPTTLLIDNPDTFVGQASDVVEQINEQAPDQELLDLVGVESPAAPDAPATPETSATTTP